MGGFRSTGKAFVQRLSAEVSLVSTPGATPKFRTTSNQAPLRRFREKTVHGVHGARLARRRQNFAPRLTLRLIHEYAVYRFTPLAVKNDSSHGATSLRAERSNPGGLA
jgi:hypothetical protein